jgi:hypothetical protein
MSGETSGENVIRVEFPVNGVPAQQESVDWDVVDLESKISQEGRSAIAAVRRLIDTGNNTGVISAKAMILQALEIVSADVEGAIKELKQSEIGGDSG